jgi:hypothetical protein
LSAQLLRAQTSKQTDGKNDGVEKVTAHATSESAHVNKRAIAGGVEAGLIDIKETYAFMRNCKHEEFSWPELGSGILKVAHLPLRCHTRTPCPRAFGTAAQPRRLLS